MSVVIYEHPLNEKLRTFLRIEHLLKQIDASQSFQSHFDYLPFFNALFALAELLERTDLRNELLKDLEKQESKLVQWAEHPEVCDDILQSMLQQVVNLQSALTSANRGLSDLKDDSFLSSIRQRLSIPGGSCEFDLPQLYSWMSLSLEEKQPTIDTWLAPTIRFREAIDLVLTIMREQVPFVEEVAAGGFYQGNADSLSLLRIKYSARENLFTTVSGNKYRYAIRFMEVNENQTKQASEQDIAFELSCS